MSNYSQEVEYVSVPRDLLERVLDGYECVIVSLARECGCDETFEELVTDQDIRAIEIQTMRNFIDTIEEEIDWEDCYPERNE